MRARRVICLGLLCMAWALDLRAQELSLFSALRLPVDASVAALGDYNVAHMGGHAALAWQNPALVATEDRPQLVLSFLDYYADIGAGAAYLRLPLGRGRLGVGLRYLSYGDFDGYDDAGRATHTFSAQMQLLHIAYGRRLGAFSWGIALMPSYVFIDDVSAYGVFMDMGVTFTHPDNKFRLGMALKYLRLWHGSSYVSRSEQQPLDLWVGASYGPKGFPFRFSANFYGLLQSTYYYDSRSPLEMQHEEGDFVDRMLSKANLGAELLLGKWIRLQSALTVARRQQLQIHSTAGLSGFSFGLACALSSFSLQIAQSFHEIRGDRRLHLGVQIHLDALRRRVSDSKK